jgi:hypothetical protein
VATTTQEEELDADTILDALFTPWHPSSNIRTHAHPYLH